MRNRACDNEFFYCLMTLESAPLTETIVDTLTERNVTTRSDQLGCLQPPVALRSDVNQNGVPINFLNDSVLSLPNPLEFEVTADKWQVRKMSLNSTGTSVNILTGYITLCGCH